MEKYFNGKFANLKEVAEAHRRTYQEAQPFPNIVFNDFFNEDYLQQILEEFPDLSKKRTVAHNNTKEIKFGSKGERFFETETKKFMHFLNSEPFLQFLQILTGIKEPLIGDPYFSGGGQHEIKPGGLLKVHADFNKHPKLKLDRRINVLVYLNKDWEEAYGGHFELWDKDMKACQKRILPLFNTLAIFSTTDFSYHGHPDPLTCPPHRSRKSLALYYYTNGRPAHEINSSIKEHGTLFKARANNDIDKKAFSKIGKDEVKLFIRDCIPPIVLKGVKKILH